MYEYVKQYMNHMVSANAVFLSIATGLVIPTVLDHLGVITGSEAVDYYAEVHKSKWNSLVHTWFMPFTYMGFNLSVPALFNLRPPAHINIQICFYIAYMTHYASISLLVGLVTSLVYFPVIVLASAIYASINRNQFKRWRSLFIGLAVSFCALSIQEYFGHYLGGDDASRMEFYPIFNAVLYAKYYSIAHLL